MSINSNSKVAFIGLGVMGYPMAGYLQQKGYQVTVYNRTTAKAEKWAGVLAAMAAGTVLIDHTTASADLARELAAAAAEKGVGFLDAPVSGGQAGAENGVLTVMIGGESADMAKAEAAIMSFARCAKLLGPAGSGQLAKMVNQICIAGVVQGLAEALNFAQNAGLDGAAVVEVISQGAASSWQMRLDAQRFRHSA
jgi:3-hydroxyisobutyrate dehydrogenase-like beta-hydroxyacid dehydrogenase